jgi:hypothetical protein
MKITNLLFIFAFILILGCVQSKKSDDNKINKAKVNFVGVIKSENGNPIKGALVQIVRASSSGWQLVVGADGKIVDVPDAVKTNSNGNFTVAIDTAVLSKFNYKVSLLIAIDTILGQFIQIEDKNLVPIIINVKKGVPKVDLKDITVKNK